MATSEHLSDETLKSALERALPSERFEEILEHLSVCASCEARMKEMEPALSSYLHFRSHVAARFPQPSAPWANIWDEMERVEPVRKLRRPAMRPIWVGAVAAAVAAVVLFWPRPDSTLHAETILQHAKASVAKLPARSRARLTVRTGAGSFVRPAVLLSNGAEDDFARRVRSEFGSADYNWNDPLNPASFAEWRDSRQRKTDVVLVHQRSEEASEYTVRTSTQDGVLQEASLTIETPAMLPVGARFVFANQEWVEISELREAAPPGVSMGAYNAVPRAAANKTEIGGPVVEPEVDLASRELHVRAAIGGLNLPVGEAIGVESDDRNQIVVTAYTLSSRDLNRLRAAVQGIDGVTVHVEEATPKTAADTDPVIDASEAIAARAHLVGQIAERFPTDVAAKLNAEDRRILWTLRERQAGELNLEIDLLYQQLREPLPNIAASESDSAQDLLKSATTVNRLVTNLYAGGHPHRDGAKELSVELSRLKQLAQGYSNYVARSLESAR